MQRFSILKLRQTMDHILQFDDMRDLCPAEIEVLILSLKGEGYTIANSRDRIIYPVAYIMGEC